MWFKCKLCLEKDKRIADLHKQVEYTQSLVFDPKASKQIPYVNIEANKILEGAQDPIDADAFNANQDWLAEQLRIQKEAMDIINGNYN